MQLFSRLNLEEFVELFEYHFPKLEELRLPTPVHMWRSFYNDAFYLWRQKEPRVRRYTMF